MLSAPTTRVHTSFLVAVEEFRAEGRGHEFDDSSLAHDMRAYLDWTTPAGFARYVDGLRRQSDEDAPRPVGYVPSTTLWWVDGADFLGRIQIRHRLTDHLLEVGGHIGYDVRPTARRQGHATNMLRAALPVSRELGIDRALITCDVDNVGSRAVIEANGGILEDERSGKLRFGQTPRNRPETLTERRRPCGMSLVRPLRRSAGAAFDIGGAERPPPSGIP